MDPNIIKVTPGSWWRYRGPGDGWGGKHCITYAANELITTWSIPQDNHGYSWLGDLQEFQRDFIPIPSVT